MNVVRRPRDGPANAMSLVAPELLVLAVLATGAAVYVIAVSKISPHPVVQALVTAIVCLTFVGAGVLALRRRPYARFGLLLAAVGFASLIGVLHEANGAAAYTAGVFSVERRLCGARPHAAGVPQRHARLAAQQSSWSRRPMST